MNKRLKFFTVGILGAAMLFAAACGENETVGGGNGGDNGDNGDNGGSEQLTPAPAYETADATLSVGGVPAKDADISDELFGVFLEDINYASQALDDNLVINGGFETAAGAKFNNKYGWTAENATFTVSDENTLLGDSFRDRKGANPVAGYALVTTEAGGAIVNSGYVPVPMAVKEGTEYHFSAFFKTNSVKAVTVTVTDGTKDYLSETVELDLSNEWVKYVRTVKANGTASEGLTLKLTFSPAGTVCADGVALETSDSTVGIKNYIYDAVKELSPKFIRFPGGCITEGENINQTYDWKNSIGAVASGENAGDDVVPAFTYKLNKENGGGSEEMTTYGEAVTRRPNVNLWENNGGEYFLMDYGIGFYEYFCLCESLGASALPVVSCGLSCQGQAFPGAALAGRHGKGVSDYIKDAADLIEFAKGDKTTTWGKIRANLGHPEPFEMNYLGVGNEQWDAGSPQSDYFETYYEKFLEDGDFMATCKKYGIQLIVGNHQQLIHCEGSIDFTTNEVRTSGVAKDAAIAYRNKGKITALSEYGIHDQHYYNSPVDFLLHAHMYDNYVREGNDRYEVFVGEYSANNNSKESGSFPSLYEVNNWFSALSEAAAMTGFERNGDIVKLAAYAPMFAPVDAAYRHWGVDMMLFTNTELVRTANYYVQQLFMQNAGTQKLTASLTLRAGLSPTFPLSSAQGKSYDIDKLYYVASLDGETGDIILKIVNASDDNVKLNIDLNGKDLTGVAHITRLSGKRTDVNTLAVSPIVPKTTAVGEFTENVLGVSVTRNSVTCVRVHTK